MKSLALSIVSAGLGAAVALVLQSCNVADAAAPTAAAAPIEAIAPRYEDIQRGVACYSLPLATVLSCVKVR
jgi:hypothetical protein